MNDLRIKISVHIEDFDSDKNEVFNTVLASLHDHRIISNILRSMLDEVKFKKIVSEQIHRGFEHIQRDFIKEINIPLTQDFKENIKLHQAKLSELFPNLCFGLSIVDGNYYIYSITSNPYIGIGPIDVPHPLGTDGVYLTTEYPEHYNKLDDGRWTYGYQGGDFYEEVIKIIPAPFDESVLYKYFEENGIKFKLPTKNIMPLPSISEPYCPDEA